MLRVAMLTVVVCSVSTPAIPANDPAPVRLDVAVRTGLVDVVVTGRGACSGDAVRVEVRRKVDRPLQVMVEAGTLMKSKSDKVQDMVCHGVKYQETGGKYRRVDVMVLNDNRPQTFLLEAYCGDFAKPTPSRENSFEIGATDPRTALVIVKGKDAKASIKTIQVAVWLHRGETEADIRKRFRADEKEFQAAGLLVQAANASQRGDAAAAGQAEEEVRVLVAGFLAELKERLANREFQPGDTVQVTAESTPVTALRRTIGTAKKGDTFKVLAVVQQRVTVEFNAPAAPRNRGWISAADIQLADNAPRGAGHPLLRKLGELVSETDLEVVTMAERGL